MRDQRRESITTNVIRCARCGGDHDQVTFVPLDHGVEVDPNTPMLTHWAPCPTNGQPILMMITDS